MHTLNRYPRESPDVALLKRLFVEGTILLVRLSSNGLRARAPYRIGTRNGFVFALIQRALVFGSAVSISEFIISSIMILPQVHLRKPCYDFYFL